MHTVALWRGPCCCRYCCHWQIVSLASCLPLQSAPAACLYARQTPNWKGGAWCICTSSTCRPAMHSTTATSAGGRQLPPLHSADALSAAEGAVALMNHTPRVLPTAPTCGLCLALLQSGRPFSSLPSTPWPVTAGSWVPTWSAAAATASSIPSACTTPRSAAPSCRAAPGPAPAAARSSGWGGHAWGPTGTAGRRTHVDADVHALIRMMLPASMTGYCMHTRGTATRAGGRGTGGGRG